MLCGAVATISWSLHLMYCYLLYHRLSPSIRGPRPMLLPWALTTLVNIVQVTVASDMTSAFSLYLFLVRSAALSCNTKT